jgi:hypothetical protein
MVALGGGERRYSAYIFLTPVLDWVTGQHHALVALYPRRKNPGVAIGEEVGWQPEPVWKDRLEEKSSLASAGDRTLIVRVVQSIVRHYTD